MMFRGHAQVHDGQHHEHKGLEHDDQDVEDRPAEVQRQLPVADQGNQDEDELAGVQVAEQAQRQRDGLRNQRDAFQKEVIKLEGKLRAQEEKLQSKQNFLTKNEYQAERSVEFTKL